ncbi:hypothetical protein K9L97_00230 [Candidatus Woesearchaeota archaeon]|nr:hypothetical protein [Candidatus Woesearchaeota archaeon]
MRIFLVFVLFFVLFFAVACDTELGHSSQDHDHDGDGFQDHLEEEHFELENSFVEDAVVWKAT